MFNRYCRKRRSGSFKLFASLGAALVFAGTAAAQGAGGGVAGQDTTSAGQVVSNTFTLDYSVNNTPQPPITNEDGTPGDPDGPTVFTVDRLIYLTVASTNSVTTPPGATGVALTYTVTNTGNDRQSYSISVEDLTNEFSLVPGSFVITYSVPAFPAEPAILASDGVTVIRPAIPATSAINDAVITEVAIGTANGLTAGSQFTPDIPAGQSFTVTITGDVPADGGDTPANDPETAENLEVEDLILIAETRDPEIWQVEGTTGTEGELTVGVNLEGATGTANDLNLAQNVFADDEGDGTADDRLDGLGSDTGTITIQTPNLTGTKDVFVIATDGSGCGTFAANPPTTQDPAQFALPGACVEYVITVANDGAETPTGFASVTATGINVEDILPPELVLVAAQTQGFTVAPTTTTVPSANTVCDGTNTTCLVRYEGAELDAPAALADPANEAFVRIHAYVQLDQTQAPVDTTTP